MFASLLSEPPTLFFCIFRCISFGPFLFSGLLSLACCTSCHHRASQGTLPPHHLLLPASQAHFRIPDGAPCLLLGSSCCSSSCRFLGALRGPFRPHRVPELPWHFVDGVELSQHPFTPGRSRHGAYQGTVSFAKLSILKPWKQVLALMY